MAVALLAALMPAASLHMLSQKCCDRHRSWRLFMQAHVQDQSLSAEAAQYPVCFEPCLCMHACMDCQKPCMCLRAVLILPYAVADHDESRPALALLN